MAYTLYLGLTHTQRRQAFTLLAGCYACRKDALEAVKRCDDAVQQYVATRSAWWRDLMTR